MVRSPDRRLSDPLSAALLPPPNETPEERDIRIRAENEAKKVSDGIDEMIRQERMEKKKARAEVNVLLLGQSESGKSTTLKRKSTRILQLKDHSRALAKGLFFATLVLLAHILISRQNSNSFTLLRLFTRNVLRGGP
jgi:hypothetical protein